MRKGTTKENCCWEEFVVSGMGITRAKRIDGEYAGYTELAITDDGRLLAYDMAVNRWVQIWHDANSLGYYID